MAGWFTAWPGCGAHALRMDASVAISPWARRLSADATARHSRMVSARQRLPALHRPTGDLMNPLLVDRERRDVTASLAARQAAPRWASCRLDSPIDLMLALPL
jgi:hypothetical protein